MTAAFFERDTLYDQACYHFECYPKAVSMFQKPDRKAARKRDQIGNTIDRFRKLMSGPNPPKTKQQAVKALSPILAFLLSAFIRSVIEWLWDQMESQDSER